MSELRDQLDTATRVRETRTRSYVDDDGHLWHVSEQAFAEYDRRRGFSLIFTSDLAVRRVRNYPDDWFTLTDLALIALSWSA
ncbi:MAG: hypothetical protein ABI601_00890 [bacterium]